MVTAGGSACVGRASFVRLSYASTTLEEIAAAIDKGSVCFYFGSKEPVLLALLNQAEQIVIDTALKLLPESCGGSPIEKLVPFLHHQAQLGVTDRENMLLIILMSISRTDRRAQDQGTLSKILRIASTR